MDSTTEKKQVLNKLRKQLLLGDKMFGIGLFEECIELTKSWKPKQTNVIEDDYRDDLREFLFNKLNNSNNVFSGHGNVKVAIESGRGLCDIAVGNRQVGLEFKKDLKSKSEINRLQGQTEDYEEDYTEGVIVVLVGNVDKYTENDLRIKFQNRLNKTSGFGLQKFRIEIINKSNNNTRIEAQQPKKLSDTDFNLQTWR